MGDKRRRGPDRRGDERRERKKQYGGTSRKRQKDKKRDETGTTIGWTTARQHDRGSQGADDQGDQGESDQDEIWRGGGPG